MKVMEIELPEQLTDEMTKLIKSGWFTNETEIIRMALIEFVRQHRFALQEKFQHDDILWALQQKESGA